MTYENAWGAYEDIEDMWGHTQLERACSNSWQIRCHVGDYWCIIACTDFDEDDGNVYDDDEYAEDDDDDMCDDNDDGGTCDDNDDDDNDDNGDYDDDEQYTFKVDDAPALATLCPHLSSDKMQ